MFVRDVKPDRKEADSELKNIHIDEFTHEDGRISQFLTAYYVDRDGVFAYSFPENSILVYGGVEW
jgi:hypothetical protein